MPKNIQTTLVAVLGVAIVMALVLGFHVGGSAVLRIGLYSQLVGAFIGGCLAIISVNSPLKQKKDVEPWLERERLAWTFIGAGCIMWGIGECIWRYFLALGLNPFPSLADFGYSMLPPLIFLGLILQPSAHIRRGRILILLDSLISMGAILAIGWFFLLGTLAQTPFLQDLGKFLSLWYPTSDVALLSCLIFLLMRGRGYAYQATARRMSLLVLGIGLSIFAISGFIFNIQQNAGTYVDGTWVDLGWPYGLMIIGIAAYLRCHLPVTPDEVLQRRMQRRVGSSTFGPARITPYVLVGILFTILTFNVLSNDSSQDQIRPVLVFTTLVVVALIVVRQILTQLDNEQLSFQQAVALNHLEAANHRVEEQAYMVAERNNILEKDVAYLKEVQTRLANGNVHARARLPLVKSGDLVPLAASLNLMADRLMHFEHSEYRLQRLSQAIEELNFALAQYRSGKRFSLSFSCTEIPEIRRILLTMGFRPPVGNPNQPSKPPIAER